VEYASKAAAFHVLPRVAFLGRIVFHEPTIGDETWLAAAGAHFNLDDTETVALLQAVCLSARDGALPDASDRDAVLTAIREFQARAARFTLAQILAAVTYAYVGNDADAGEHAPPNPDEEEQPEPDPCDVSPLLAGVIRDGLALRLGTIPEIMKMRASQVLSAAETALCVEHGPSVFKNKKSKAFGDYMRALDALRGRGATNG
jgi:hypothetical protein